jgi:hypothetical protein
VNNNGSVNKQQPNAKTIAQPSLVRRHSQTLYFLVIPLLVLGIAESFQRGAIDRFPLTFAKARPNVSSCGGYDSAEMCGQIIQSVLLYAGFCFLNLVMCITAVGISISVLRLECDQDKDKNLTPILSLACVLGGILAFIAVLSKGKLETLLQNTLGGLYDIPPFRDHSPAFLTTLYATNIFLPISASIVAVACIRSAYRLPSAKTIADTSAPAHLAELSVKMRALKRATLAAALLLVTAVLEFQFRLQLPIPYLRAASPSPSVSFGAAVMLTGGASGYKSFVDGLITVQGIEYTALLLVVFGIPAILIHHNATQVAHIQAPKNVPPMTPSKYLEGFGFAFSLPTYFADVITVAMPAVAASISPLIRISAAT